MNIKDLTTGWGLTFRKLSAQIAAVELVTVFMVMVPFIDFFTPRVLLAIFIGFTLIKLLASNLNQNTVKSYDPTKFKLVPLGADDETAG